MDSFVNRLFSGNLSRRDWLRSGGLLGLSSLFGATSGRNLDRSPGAEATPQEYEGGDRSSSGLIDGEMKTMGTVDPESNGFDPVEMLSDFEYGETHTADDGQTVREFRMVAEDKQIEVAPGVFFQAWTYDGRVPGPSLRCVEGDRVRIEFINAGSHPHTIHFHGIHPASMDGVPNIGDGVIESGERTVYEFDAKPFGCHLYHCHAIPLKRHIHKGLYGAFIVDPDPEKYDGPAKEAARERNHQYPECDDVREMVMVMNGFDTNFDGENEIYAANTVAFEFVNRPIPVKRDRRQRIYLANVTEFDPVNSFHLHANFFDYYNHGTTLEPTEPTVDTIMQCQGQRGILEFSFDDFEPGQYMFHAHQSEFAELGWMGFFDVHAAEGGEPSVT